MTYDQVASAFRQAQQRALNGDTNGALYDALSGLIRLTETLAGCSTRARRSGATSAAGDAGRTRSSARTRPWAIGSGTSGAQRA